MQNIFEHAGKMIVILVILCPIVAAWIDLFRRRVELETRLSWLLLTLFAMPIGGLIYWLARYGLWIWSADNEGKRDEPAAGY